MDFEILYRSYRPLVYSVAYRMLGSVTEAEDIVQDVFIRSQHLDDDHVNNIKAYLVKMTTNHCLNVLTSARKKRELYTGHWLPEPEVSTNQLNPAEAVVQNESVSYAFLVMIEQLNPVERAVFVLREALEYDYQEIADILDKSEVNCRKIYSRCKQKLQHEVPAQPQHSDQTEQLVQTFLQGTKTGRFKEFINLLKEDVVLVSDGGGKVRAAMFPILGRQRVHAFLEGIFARAFFQSENLPVLINGQMGILAKKDGHVNRAICFEWDIDQQMIRKVYVIVNPEKLSHIQLL